MARINACSKGKRAEREWAHWLSDELGDDKARRGFGQAAGGSGRPDVETSIPNLHFEVKAVESLNLGKAMDQAIRDARVGYIPIVAHKKNRAPWHVTLLASDLVELSHILVNFLSLKKEE